MPLELTYLSVEFTIGGRQVKLASEKIKALEDMRKTDEVYKAALAKATKSAEETDKKNETYKTARETFLKNNPDATEDQILADTAVKNAKGELDTASTASKTDADAVSVIESGALKKSFKEGLSFKMSEGDKLQCSVRDLVNWFTSISTGEGSDPANKAELPASFQSMTTSDKSPDALNGIVITIWNLHFNTKFEFGMNVQVALTEEFYKGIGMPPAISKVFTLDSIGVGFEYKPAKAIEYKD